MKTKLITALRTAAKALEEGTFDYKWEFADRCNCGVVACAITGLASSELLPLIKENTPPKEDGKTFQLTWTQLAARRCPITGVPNDIVFKQLFETGMSIKDIQQLEALSNPKIIARSGIYNKVYMRHVPIEKMDYQNKTHLIAYLRAWADILVEEGQADVVTAPKQDEPVAA